MQDDLDSLLAVILGRHRSVSLAFVVDCSDLGLSFGREFRFLLATQ